MGLYADLIFPHLMDWALGSATAAAERDAALRPARGHVLEIGLGTGLNFPHYPTAVTAITGIDPVRLLPATVKRRIGQSRAPVATQRAAAEALPFRDASFDSIVTTWTFCSVREPLTALREVRRALKPGGRYIFLEHGQSDDPGVARWQDRLTPLQRIIGCGCHLNRNIAQCITQAGLRIEHLDRYRLPQVPRLIGEMYRGTATASAR